MKALKYKEYPRQFHLRDGQTRRVIVPLWKSIRGSEETAAPTARMQSLAEALHARSLLIDRNVVGILDSPPPIHYKLNGKALTTYPDFEVTYLDSETEIHEVKDSRRKWDPKLAARLRAIATACMKVGKLYRVIWSDECYEQPRRHNVALILRYHNHPGADGFLPAAMDFVSGRDRTKLDELIVATGIDMHQFLALVCAGHFEIDLCKPITGDTIVEL